MQNLQKVLVVIEEVLRIVKEVLVVDGKVPEILEVVLGVV